MNDLQTCKQAVSDIIKEALGGHNPTFATRRGHIKWGEVEKAILESIEQHWPELEDDGK